MHAGAAAAAGAHCAHTGTDLLETQEEAGENLEVIKVIPEERTLGHTVEQTVELKLDLLGSEIRIRPTSTTSTATHRRSSHNVKSPRHLLRGVS